MLSFFLAADKPENHVADLILWKVGDTPVLTMHMVTLVVIGAVFVLFMMWVARAIAVGPESQGNERYMTKGRLAQMIEAMVVYLRDEMLEPVMGAQHARKYLPYLMSLFFFILFMNLFGLIPVVDLLLLFGIDSPIGGTATANIMVTAALALIAFFVIQIHAIRELGLKGFLQHLCGGLVPGPIMLAPVIVIVFVVELLGLFIKPTALAIRLFANMVAGHILMAVLLSFGTMAAKGGMGTLGITTISVVSGIFAVLITFLELFVAFLQAFIFMFLTAVF
ncbi:MAG: F0F1 ATP synthase subunit A, partial [Phycisphaerales bacterium]